MHAVTGDTRIESCNWTLKVLAEAMHKRNVAAVIKRIYAKGPQFREMPHILFTCPDHGPECLLLAKLPFEHEMRWKETVPIKKEVFESLEVKNELKEPFDAYLSSLTITDNDIYCNKVLYGISEYLLQNPECTSEFDHVINSLLDSDYNKYERKVPACEMNKMLEKRSQAAWDNLKDLLPVFNPGENNDIY